MLKLQVAQIDWAMICWALSARHCLKTTKYRKLNFNVQVQFGMKMMPKYFCLDKSIVGKQMISIKSATRHPFLGGMDSPCSKRNEGESISDRGCWVDRRHTQQHWTRALSSDPMLPPKLLPRTTAARVAMLAKLRVIKY